MPKSIDEVKEDLRLALPYFMNAVERCSKEGNVKLGIMCEKSDGTVRLEMSFDCREFFQDVFTALNDLSPSVEDLVKADAIAFKQKHNLQTGNS